MPISKEFWKRLIVIGASVGRLTAFSHLLLEFSPHFSPVIIVQHMFREMVTPWVNNLQRFFPHLKISVPKNEEVIKTDQIYVAEGGKHCEVKEGRKIHSYRGERVNFVIPSITFISAAKIYAENVLPVNVLTSTGRDGAYGAKKIQENGGIIIVEYESTCVSDSIPKAVVEANLADKVLLLHKIIFNLCTNGWMRY